MERAKKRVAIVGGGLSGLVAAYEIKKAIMKENLPFDFVVLERMSFSGGMIRTFQTEDGPVDVGASSFDLRRGDERSFLAELGLEDQIQYSQGGKLDRYSNHEFVSSDKPTYHGIPLRIVDLFYDKELSTGDKLRALFNYSSNQARSCEKKQLTTKEFLDLRFCSEISNLIALPHYPENIYGSMELCAPPFFDPNLLSLFEKGTARKVDVAERERLMDRSGQEYTLVGGMATLVHRLLEFVGDHVETNRQLTDVSRLERGVLSLELNKEDEIRVGSIISTVSISELTHIMKEGKRGSGLLPVTSNSDMGTILFQFPKGAITRYPSGFGFVIPKRSVFHISKATFLNRKWESLADAKYDYLLVEVGRRQEDMLIQLPDEAILPIIEQELEEILGLRESYHSASVFRWQQATPHVTKEAREAMVQNEERFKNSFSKRGIFIGGNGYHGYGMHNAIKEGRTLAANALAYMKTITPVK